MGGGNIVVSGCTESHLCQDCNTVFERLIKSGDYNYKEGDPKENPNCAQCDSLNILPWKQSDGCPLCQGGLKATPTCCEVV